VIRVLVVTAIDLEARTLGRQLGLEPVTGARWPHFRGGVLEVASVGLRAAELEARARSWRVPDVVVAAGACGALSPDLGSGDLVVPDTVLSGEGERLTTDPLPGLGRRGAVLTVDRVVETAEAKARMWLETGALAVDMESAIILAWARREGLGAAVVRGVSDCASEGVPVDLAGVVRTDGQVSRGRAVRAVLARPRALGEALALRRGTAAALSAVAGALASVARRA
jgi:adenosylhomocysteine nucleosidase